MCGTSEVALLSAYVMLALSLILVNFCSSGEEDTIRSFSNWTVSGSYRPKLCYCWFNHWVSGWVELVSV